MSIQTTTIRCETLSLNSIDLMQMDRDCIEQQYTELSNVDTGNYFVGIPLDKNDNIVGSAIFTFLFMVFFALLRFHSKDLLNKMIQTIWQRKNVEVLLSDGIISNSYYYFVALLLSFSMLSITLSYIIYDELRPILILGYLSIFMLYHFIVLSIISMCGWCFNNKTISTEIIANLWSINISVGVFIAPFVVAMLFMKTFAIQFILNIVIYFFFIYILLIFIRIASILFSHRVSIFYIILYLCALEIVPLMILTKVITE